ncbi:MAG: alanine/glycine:cation symporter family protein [Christensenellales bacterium]|jgi:AGCS family alanine or glycine:cation symporter
MSELIQSLNDMVWGAAMLCLIVGTGIFLMVRLKFRPLKNLGFALRQVCSRRSLSPENTGHGDMTPFESLMTTLAACIGTGNIVGVSSAMVLGGPGALLWMCVSSVFGLATIYAESVLGVKYRVTNHKGEMSGGPMYVLKQRLKPKWLGRALAFLFAVFTVLASFGIGNMTQSNSVSEAMFSSFSVPPWITGLITAALAGIVILSGVKAIGRVCANLVPVMAILYIVATLVIICLNIRNLPAGLSHILSEAFSLRAAGGGAMGTVLAQALRWGVARGVFSNEAGLGSAPIAAAAARTDSPARQGYINMTGVFFDTIVMCTLTGLAIAASGVLGAADPVTGEALTGGPLTIAAFSAALGPAGGYIVTLSLALFGFSTLIGWGYYGEKALEYLFRSDRARIWYRVTFIALIFVGATTTMRTVWDFSDAANGLMAVPNLICLLFLSGVVVRETDAFEVRRRREARRRGRFRR